MSRNIHQEIHDVVLGDRTAATWLYDRFAPGLFRRLAHRYAYPRGLDPEDLLQDAFVFFFQNDCRVLRQFLDRVPATDQTEARLERHLWDLSCGLATNRLRSASLRRDAPLEAAGEAAPGPGAERRTIDRDRLARLDRCLEQGGRKAYVYYKLRYVDGYSPAEISEITGWPRRTTYELRQTLNRRLERCKQRLGLDA